MPQTESCSVLTLTVNGAEKQTGAQNLAVLLEELSLDSTSLVAEVNGTIVRPEYFSATALHNGDSIELVRFVGGG